MKKLLMAAGGGTLLGLVATTQVAGPLLAQEAANNASVYEQLDLFGDIFERIRAGYVEDVQRKGPDRSGHQRHADIAWIRIRATCQPMMPPICVCKRAANLAALGIEVTQEEGWVKVVSPMDGTPADAAGILAGDFITAVDGENVLGLTLDQAVEMMRGT